MSRSDKDKPGGHIRRSKGRLACGCCATITRTLYSEQRATRERAAREYEELAGSIAIDHEPCEDGTPGLGHTFVASNRCIHCGANDLDTVLYPELTPCIQDRDPIVYSTGTDRRPTTNLARLTTL